MITQGANSVEIISQVARLMGASAGWWPPSPPQQRWCWNKLDRGRGVGGWGAHTKLHGGPLTPALSPTLMPVHVAASTVGERESTARDAGKLRAPPTSGSTPGQFRPGDRLSQGGTGGSGSPPTAGSPNIVNSPPPTAMNCLSRSCAIHASYPDETGITCRACPVSNCNSRSSVFFRNKTA